MSKIDHLTTGITNPDRAWAAIVAHVALPSSGPWSYEVEQHRRWHFLEYLMSLGCYTPTEDDWDWVYMLGPYADNVNRLFYMSDDSLIRSKRRIMAESDGDVLE